MKKIVFYYNKLKSTFWFIPVLIIIFSIFLSIGLIILDEEVTISRDGIGQFIFVNSADSARSILSTISGAMIGVAGTVFSVVLVALTLASSQFGPRLIKNFMYVTLNQVVLGSYISTYLYCLFVLNAIRESDNYTFMPVISIFFAIIAALINIILLIVFIHQIAISIQADKVISDISAVIHKQLETIYPKTIGQNLNADENKVFEELKLKYSKSISIKSQKSGYFQYIDGESLLKIMTKFESVIELHFKPGDHIVEGIEIGKIYTNSDLQKDQIEKIHDQFVIGKIKVSDQDLEFSINQMVEIASRALSPGVNDPFTAITCIDNLTASLCSLDQINLPSKYRIDEENQLRIIAKTINFEGVIDAAFNQIRQFSAGSTAVIIRLMEALITIESITQNENHKTAILKHAKMVLNTGKQNIKEEFDYKDLEQRARKIISVH